MADTTTAAARSAAVILRKLAPPPPPSRFVSRDRLDRQLRRLVADHRVIVVAATAGAGKTTAVATATEGLNRPRAWLSVDRTDAAPGRLVTYLEAALARVLPEVDGIATRALATGIPHAEAAGLLVEAVADAPLLVVLDDLERLGTTEEAWAVLESFLRYAPRQVTAVLLSRRDIPIGACELPPPPATAVIGEADLAFTVDEAAHALNYGVDDDAPDPEAEAVVRATGGWVTGVLFRADGAGEVAPGRASPLADYLSAHVLAQLDDADRDLLVRTALLEEVDPAAATALGVANAGERMRALRCAHLPVSWQPDGLSMRAHPLFREHLLDLLQHRGPAEVRALRVAHAELLIEQGHDEEAVEELLRAGALETALKPAERSIARVIERMDLAVAERWLARLEPVTPTRASELHFAELLLAMGRGHFRRAAAVGDRLDVAGERDRFVRGSDRAAGLLAWSYGEVGRFDALNAVLAAAGDGPSAQAVRYTNRVTQSGVEPRRPELTGGPTDALILAADHALGRFAGLALPVSNRWVTAVLAPWRIAALRCSGRTEAALELYVEASRTTVVKDSLNASPVGADLLVDAGRREEALAEIQEGRAFTEEHGGRWRWILTWIAEGRLRLRLDGDPEAALAALAVADRELEGFAVASAREACDAWMGYALLLAGDVDDALLRLRAAVESMLGGDRIVDLPFAAIYLAEAEWQSGNEDGADRAADLALAASSRLGSNHLLLQALVDFPAVASRRIDAEAGTDSVWHGLGRAIVARGAVLEVRVGVTLELQDLGRPQLRVDGEERRPRIAKTYELLAFLAGAPDKTATRDELLDALFDGRDDASTRAYLRQAIGQLSRLLPDADALSSAGGLVRLAPEVRLSTTSGRFVQRLDEARGQEGPDRLATTLAALALHDAGDYLEGARTAWVDERRRALSAQVSKARHEAALLAFEQGRHLEALRLNERALLDDPVREDAWRLRMEINGALGDDAGVLAAFRDCTAALAELGAEPAPSTRKLLTRLRR
ncbi:MAG: transcriptional activator domain protein [Conexibacter sp.]|nr:transcriptional activator domain protein [Conexibacter sp.]